VVYEFEEGASPESILLAYPGLNSLENVYWRNYLLFGQPERSRNLSRGDGPALGEHALPTATSRAVATAPGASQERSDLAPVMKPRFQADSSLTVAIVNGVRRREPSIDFRPATWRISRRTRRPGCPRIGCPRRKDIGQPRRAYDADVTSRQWESPHRAYFSFRRSSQRRNRWRKSW
jgi:hypothetical protein